MPSFLRRQEPRAARTVLVALGPCLRRDDGRGRLGRQRKRTAYGSD